MIKFPLTFQVNYCGAMQKTKSRARWPCGRVNFLQSFNTRSNPTLYTNTMVYNEFITHSLPVVWNAQLGWYWTREFQRMGTLDWSSQ